MLFGNNDKVESSLNRILCIHEDKSYGVARDWKGRCATLTQGYSIVLFGNHHLSINAILKSFKLLRFPELGSISLCLVLI